MEKIVETRKRKWGTVYVQVQFLRSGRVIQVSVKGAEIKVFKGWNQDLINCTQIKPN